jgi:EmrB/QacA subfamily drug resistance transporter
MNLVKPMKMGEPPGKTSVLIVVTSGAFLTSFMSGAVNVALPKIGSELAMEAILLGWITTAYYLATVVFNIPFGRIADIYGRKKVFAWGMIIFTVTSLLLVMTDSGIVLIVLRFVQGTSAAMVFSTSTALLTSVFPVGERGRVMGLTAATVYIGFAVGPFLGGLLTQYLGWRSIFLVTVPVGLLVIALIFWRMKGDWAEAKGEGFDIIGSVLYTLMLVAVVYGFTRLPDMFGIYLIVAGSIGFIVFVLWERKVISPLVDIRLFRENRVFVFSSIATLINYGATFAIGFLLSLYLQYIKGLSPQDTGFIMVSQPIVQAIFAPLAGRLSDRVQPRLVASAGMAVTAIGLLLFVFLSEETVMPQIVASLVLVGLGLGLFSSPNMNAVMSSVEKKFYGVASATVPTMRYMGATLSMGVVMILFAINMGSAQVTPEYYGAFLQSARMTFLISLILCVFGICISMATGKADKPNR